MLMIESFFRDVLGEPLPEKRDTVQVYLLTQLYLCSYRRTKGCLKFLL